MSQGHKLLLCVCVMLGMYVHMIIYVSELVKLVTVAGSCVLLCSFLYVQIHNLQAHSQVTGVSLSKNVSQGRPTLLVTWTAHPVDVNITEYQVQYRRNDTSLFSTQINVSPPATSVVMSALDAGTAYDVRVRLRIEAVNGEWCEVHTERTFDSKYIFVF